MANGYAWQSSRRLTIRRKVFTVLRTTFHVYDDQGSVVAYSQAKAFKLREEMILWTDDTRAVEVLRIKARQIIDIGASYDVIDPATNAIVGTYRRRGFKSIVRDSWEILNPAGEHVGAIVEDTAGLALARRLLPMVTFLCPQQFRVELAGTPVCEFSQNRNPFIQKLMVDCTMDTGGRFDMRLALAAGLLLQLIEGRQQN